MYFNKKKKKETFTILNLALILNILLFFNAYGYQKDKGLWIRYKQLFLKENRIYDNYFKDKFHSEAQAFGLFFAVYFEDKETFDKIWKWTRNNLKLKDKNLFSWLWGKDINGNWRKLDYNNATDADIIIAWSLLKAYQRWNDKKFLYEALSIIGDIKKYLIIKKNNNLYLLPGLEGFLFEQKIVLNPSYYIIPAFYDFYKHTKDPTWKQLIEDFYKQLPSFERGSFHLIPDWVILSKDPCEKEKEPMFGYDSIRLYSILVTSNKNLPSIEKLKQFVKKFILRGWIPDKILLKKSFVSINDAPAAFYLIFSKLFREKTTERKLLEEKAWEKIKYENSYYSYSLFIFTHILDQYKRTGRF